MKSNGNSWDITYLFMLFAKSRVGVFLPSSVKSRKNYVKKWRRNTASIAICIII